MEQWLRLFDHSGDGVFAVDATQRIVYWNATAEQLLGYSAEQAVGRPCHRLLCGVGLDGEHVCQTGCEIHAGLHPAGVAPPAFELLVRDASRALRRIEISTIATHDHPGTDVAIVHLFRLLDEPAAATGLHILLLGPAIVRRPDGSELNGDLWRRTKVRSLLALLALERHGGVHRETLLDLLWPDKERAAALRNLNTTVHYLRRCLEPELERGEQSRYVQVQGDHYCLGRAASHWLDVEAFESGLQQARRAPTPAAALPLYQESLALYRGDFLTALDLHEGQYVGETERLRELFLVGMETLAALYEEEGQQEQAQDVYRQILCHDNLRESACARLMALLLRQGDRAGALRCYEALGRRLQQEMELAPGAELQALYRNAQRR